MTEHEGQRPFGDDGLYIDITRPSIGHYTLSDRSKIADECYRVCDPDEIVSICAQQAVAELCMRNAMQGGGAQESVVEVEIQCKGPKRRFFGGGKKCGSAISIHEVSMPLDMDEGTQSPEDS